MAAGDRVPSLLFVAPIMPATDGNGLAMRAGVFLEAFARDFAVTLLVVPVADPEPRITPFVTKHVQQAITLSLAEMLDPLWTLCERVLDPQTKADALAAYPRPAMCRYATTPCIAAIADAIAGQRFDVVHVMRSYLTPYALPALSPADAPPPLASLDLDDDETVAHERIAALLERTGRPHDARIATAEAGKFRRFEADWLPRYQRLIACTAAHADALAAGHPRVQTAVVPNTIALPPLVPRSNGTGRRILFVGNLSYLPNVDGIVDFVNETLPRLRAHMGCEVPFRIVGSSPTAAVTALTRAPGVELVPNPPHLDSHYRWADLVVIPLHAGGGTRIKLLEAFAYGVPAVATPVGAEGVAVENRVHLLLAETPQTFADACRELLSDQGLATQLSHRARRLVQARYAHSVGIRRIREVFAPTASVEDSRPEDQAGAPNRPPFTFT